MTGASKGIGLAIAQTLAGDAQGSKVIAVRKAPKHELWPCLAETKLKHGSRLQGPVRLWINSVQTMRDA